jgi:hypothetical protein
VVTRKRLNITSCIHFLSCSVLQLLFCLWPCSLQVLRWRVLAGHYAHCCWLTAHSQCWGTTSLQTACTGAVPPAESWLTGSCLSAPASTPDTKQSACGRRCWKKEWYLMVICDQWLSLLNKQSPPPHGVTVLGGPGPSHYRGFTHSDTPHSLGLLWTGDQPNAEASAWQRTTLIRDNVLGGIPILNPSKPAAADPCLRPCGHWDRHQAILVHKSNNPENLQYSSIWFWW